MSRQHAVMLAAFFAVLLWSGIGVFDRLTWILEVTPALLALAIVAALWNRFRFTNLLLWLITLHCIVLMVGGKYSYAEMPLFNWLRDEFQLARNYYDRVGHFMQGFVPALVAREVLLRLGVIAKRAWTAPIALALAVAFSAVYEFAEWWAAAALGDSADHFLGTQGDPWDTQWDMFMCTVGALVSLKLLGRTHDRELKRLEAGRRLMPDTSGRSHPTT
jgi:putative membrane protein